MVPLPHVKFGEHSAIMKFVREVFNNRSLGDPISHELVWYPEFHTGPDHVQFKFHLVYSVELRLWLNNQG